MKVLPKRKGNDEEADNHAKNDVPLNESPSEKEGKSSLIYAAAFKIFALNESPSEKEGK